MSGEVRVDDEYLGDGVYASFDGWFVWLDLRAQDPRIRIALEPVVLRNLDRYRQTISDAVRRAQESQGHEP